MPKKLRSDTYSALSACSLKVNCVDFRLRMSIILAVICTLSRKALLVSCVFINSTPET